MSERKLTAQLKTVCAWVGKHLHPGTNALTFCLKWLPSIWQDLKWLQTTTTMPILVKGVMTAEDSKHSVVSLFFLV